MDASDYAPRNLCNMRESSSFGPPTCSRTLFAIAKYAHGDCQCSSPPFAVLLSHFFHFPFCYRVAAHNAAASNSPFLRVSTDSFTAASNPCPERPSSSTPWAQRATAQRQRLFSPQQPLLTRMAASISQAATHAHRHPRSCTSSRVEEIRASLPVPTTPHSY